MKKTAQANLPLGPLSLIVSKYYYGVLSKSLEKMDIDRYFTVLYFLNWNNGCNQKTICEALAVDKTAMVKVMDYLIKAGYVSRRANPEDRREQFVSLTARGKKQTGRVVKAFRTIDAAAFEGLSPEEREIYYSITARLTQNLKELPANDLFFNYKKTAGEVKKTRPVKK
jgi:DNA-binding MarR family transcriptional regulator